MYCVWWNASSSTSTVFPSYIEYMKKCCFHVPFVGCVGKFPRRAPCHAASAVLARLPACSSLLWKFWALEGGASYSLWWVAREIAMSRHIFCGRWLDFRPTSIQNHCVALKASDRPRLGCLPSSKLDETFFVKKFWNAVTNFCLPPAVVASRSLRNIQVFSPRMLGNVEFFLKPKL